MTTPIETFRPVISCTDDDLRNGVNQGLWLMRALFLAMGHGEDTDGESVALGFLGESIATEVQAKQTELIARHAAGGGR